jgi:hypothetical protein
MGFLVNVIWKSPLRVTINQFDLLSERTIQLANQLAIDFEARRAEV